MQIIVYTSAFNVFINQVSKIMNKSNAKSLLDNTVMLYKQTVSSMHDLCLDQRSFKCKIEESCSNILFIWGPNHIFYVPLHPVEEKKNIAILLGLRLSFLESHVLPCINLYTRNYNVFKT